MDTFKARGARIVSALGAALLTLTLTVPAQAAVFVDDTPEAAWRTNGPVLATVVVGDTVVVGGHFTDAVSPTGQHVARRNLAAFSLSTGALLTGWQADADADVRALDTDGTDVWVGGYFTHVAGQGRRHLAKVSVATGALDDAFDPAATNTVRAIAVVGADVVVGGMFSRVNGALHRRIARLDARTGAPRPGFTASASKAVWGLAVDESHGVVYASGVFDALNGVPRQGAGALDLATGDTTGPAFAGSAIPTLGLDLSPDGTMLYGALSSNTCVAWRTTTGNRAWAIRTNGNIQAVKYFDGTVYCGFHDGYQGDTTVKLLAVDAVSGAIDASFRPSINSFLGVRAIDVTADGLVIGGNFNRVSGVSARGFALFRR